MKRVLYLSKTDRTGPSSRYRIYQFLPGLEAAGIRVEVSPLFRRPYFALLERPFLPRVAGKALYTAWRFAARAAALLRSGRYGAVVIEHQLFPYLPPWAERILVAAGVPFALEFDDAIFLTPFHGRKMDTLCRLAGTVIVGNRHLAEYARARNPSVEVVPTVVDADRYRPREAYRLREDRPVVGWIGLKYNFPFLAEIAPALPEGTRLRVVSSAPPALPLPPGVELDFVPWSEEREGELLAGFDVGIMPLPDTAWARGKCGLKILQYMAAGVPVAASPVGVNAEIVRHGENGLLARGPGAWRRALAELCSSEALRARLGRAGRRTVERGYTLRHGLERLVRIYRGL